MALTLFPLNTTVNGGLDSVAGRKFYIGFVQTDNNYPVGGYPVDPTLFGMTQIDQFYCGSTGAQNQQIVLSAAPSAPTGLQTSNYKIKLVLPNTAAEAGGGFGSAGTVWPVLVVGI